MKKKLVLISIQVFIILILVISNQTDSFSQIRSRTKTDSSDAARNGKWLKPEHYQFEVAFPKLNAVPPINPSMPIEILLSYLYLDSLMRSVNSDYLSLNYQKRWENEKKKTILLIIL